MILSILGQSRTTILGSSCGLKIDCAKDFKGLRANPIRMYRVGSSWPISFMKHLAKVFDQMMNNGWPVWSGHKYHQSPSLLSQTSDHNHSLIYDIHPSVIKPHNLPIFKMPTAANAINNAVDILGWSHTIIAGRRRKNAQKYSNWRNEVEEKIKGKGWKKKTEAGNQYDAFVLECVDLEDFPVSAASTIRRPRTNDTEPAHKALNELMLDCFKKVREAKQRRKRNAAQEELAAGEGGEADEVGPPPKRPRYEQGRPVVIYILDSGNNAHHPATGWNWNVAEVKKLAVLYDSSVNDIHRKISSELPQGRKVREIIGALANAPPDNNGVIPPLHTPADVTHIRSDEDLDAFLRLTEAKPIKFLVILHKVGGANTPPPQGRNAGTYYFDVARFDEPEYYNEEVEDSEEEVRQRAGGKRGVPRVDYKFEEKLEDIRRRIRRQERLLATLEEKHKAAFPAAIHGADPGGELRVLCYGEGDN